MALKRLFSEEMLQLSGTLTDTKSKAHKAILASADLAPAMPRLTAAHEVLAKLTQPASADPRLAAIIAEEAVIDPRHDDLIRGAHGLLTGAAFLLGEDGAPLLALRDTLFPDGLSSAQKSYRAEAGQAAQLAARLTPALRARLASIAVGPKSVKTTLEHCIDELLTLGARLGVLEDEKGRLQAGAAEQAGSGLGAALLAARNQWVRVANSLVANGELAGLDPETDQLVFGPLRAAEKAAERRTGNASAKKNASAAGADPTTPEVTAPGDAGDAVPKK